MEYSGQTPGLKILLTGMNHIGVDSQFQMKWWSNTSTIYRKILGQCYSMLHKMAKSDNVKPLEVHATPSQWCAKNDPINLIQIGAISIPVIHTNKVEQQFKALGTFWLPIICTIVRDTIQPPYITPAEAAIVCSHIYVYINNTQPKFVPSPK